MQYSDKRENTKRRILEAFSELYIESDISQITVKMICAKANINRSTFYTYFTDVLEARKSLEMMMVNELAQKVLVEPDKLECLNVDWIMSKLLELLREKKALPIVVIRKSTSDFAEIVAEALIEAIKANGRSLQEEEQQDIITAIRYHMGGVVALIETLQGENLVMDAEQLLKFVARCASKGALTVIKETVKSADC